MPRAARNIRRRPPVAAELDQGMLLQALPHPVLVVDVDDVVVAVNPAAEIFLGGSRTVLLGNPLALVIPADSPVFRLIEQVRATGASLADYEILVESPRVGSRVADVQVAAVPERPGNVVVTLIERSIAHKLHRQLHFQGAARSVTAMAAMMAHEVKNPLSGIRGAAQLLEQGATNDERSLTRLIRDETDRICNLIDRMEAFADQRPIEKTPVNIHAVLDHCRRLASTGFGRKVTFVERYDPSLPPVLGNHDILVQVFVNLLKNAAEAVPSDGGEIVLSTAYRYGMRVSVAGSERPMDLPLQISIQDNGSGIPDYLRTTLFEPFVSGKPRGTGLGLAFVAKAVADHGGMIEVDSRPKRTVFRLTFPMAATSTPKPDHRFGQSELNDALRVFTGGRD